MLFAPGLRIALLQSARHPLISIEDVDGVIVVLNRRPVADCAAFSIHAVEVRATFEEQALQQVSKLATAVPTVSLQSTCRKVHRRTVGEVVPAAWDNFDGPQITWAAHRDCTA